MSPEAASLPNSKRDLIALLRTLAERRPQSVAELRGLEQESVALARHIQARMSLHDVPKAVWHFLSDPDIRFKDAAYADLQRAELNRELEQWTSDGDI